MKYHLTSVVDGLRNRFHKFYIANVFASDAAAEPSHYPSKKGFNAKKNHLHVLKVAEKIQEELEDYRSREDDIKRMKHEMGMEGQDEAAGLLSDNTQV